MSVLLNIDHVSGFDKTPHGTSWSGPNLYYPTCNEFRWLNETGQSVALHFTGAPLLAYVPSITLRTLLTRAMYFQGETSQSTSSLILSVGSGRFQ